MLYDLQGQALEGNTVATWLFFGILAFGALSCQARSLGLPCCEKAQATWRGHVCIFWQRPRLRSQLIVSISYQIYEWRHLQVLPASPHWVTPNLLSLPSRGPLHCGVEKSQSVVTHPNSWPTKSVKDTKMIVVLIFLKSLCLEVICCNVLAVRPSWQLSPCWELFLASITCKEKPLFINDKVF